MKIQTLNHSLEVSGINWNPEVFAPATLAGFDKLIVDGTLVLSYDDLKELPLAIAQEIWEALDNAANKACDEWRETARDIRRWLGRQ